VNNVAINGPVLVPLEKSNNGWKGDAKEDMERCSGSYELMGEIWKSHRKHMIHSSDSYCCDERCIFQIWLRNSKQASLSPKYFLYPPCVWTYIL